MIEILKTSHVLLFTNIPVILSMRHALVMLPCCLSFISPPPQCIFFFFLNNAPPPDLPPLPPPPPFPIHPRRPGAAHDPHQHGLGLIARGVAEQAPRDAVLVTDLFERAIPRVARRRFERCAVLDLDPAQDRKSTRLNSSHLVISYAVFCLK